MTNEGGRVKGGEAEGVRKDFIKIKLILFRKYQ